MLRQCLALVSKGVPFDVAFSLSDVERMAWCIIHGEFNGQEYDFDAMEWIEKKP